MICLFVGVGLPADIRMRLSALGAGVPGARWVPPENLHLTLRFIGEVTETDAEDIHDTLLSVRTKAFDIALSGVGHFESKGQVHTLWAGIEKNPELTALRDRIEFGAGAIRPGAGRAPLHPACHPGPAARHARPSRLVLFGSPCAVPGRTRAGRPFHAVLELSAGLRPDLQRRGRIPARRRLGVSDPLRPLRGGEGIRSASWSENLTITPARHAAAGRVSSSRITIFTRPRARAASAAPVVTFLPPCPCRRREAATMIRARPASRGLLPMPIQ